jgi:hypothetical protein
VRAGAGTIKQLRGGHGDLVVAVDFGGVREEAGFPDLLEHLESDHEIVVPVTTVRLEGPSEDIAQRQLVSWLDDIRRTGRRVAAVLGYCAGSPLAVRLLRELAPQAPTLVLLDPSWPDGAVLREAHEVAVRTLLSALPESVRIEPFVGEAEGSVAEDLAGLARVLVDDYARTASVVADRLSLRREAVDGLVKQVDRHLTYLTVSSVEAARVSDSEQLGASDAVLTILSARTPGEVARIHGATWRTDLPRPQLLADPGVAARIADFVHGRAPVA